MLILNSSDRRSVCQQMKEELRRMVLIGAVRPGETLPGVRELSTRWAINPKTIQQAYQKLADEGYVMVTQGQPPVVLDIRSSGGRKADLLRQLDGAAAELIWMGMTVEQLSQRLVEVWRGGAEDD